MTAALTSPDQIERLRRRYNATVAEVIVAHDELRILRVRPDRGIPDFESGQYVVLGLGHWEPRVHGVAKEHLDEAHLRTIAKRAYSISCSILDPAGHVTPAGEWPFLEFYITLVRRAPDHAPELTPRLFTRQEGDRLFVGDRAVGHYTLEHVGPQDDVVLLGTGTGEAPHNTMIAELLARRHNGRIVAATCVRYRRDLAYLETHRRLELRFPNYRYLTLTTREAENLDAGAPGYVGKVYLQEYVDSGNFERDAKIDLDPAHVHVFLCGSPAMIGAPVQLSDGSRQYPEVSGMVEILTRRGFRLDHPRQPGNLHFEKYW